jgi:hypothetical protein
MRFRRVRISVEDIQLWNASSNGVSFVISYESRGGPGLQGDTGFAASWRPILHNRPAVRVLGSPFRTLGAAERACEVTLGHLIGDSPSSGPAMSKATDALRRTPLFSYS